MCYEIRRIYRLIGEISGPHGGEYEDDCLLGYCAMKCGRRLPTFQGPDDGDSKHLWNVGKFIPDYMV
jgi:hypothetical protein